MGNIGLNIERCLEILDAQRKHCVDAGAVLSPGKLYINTNDAGGDEGQNDYYNGHTNLMEAMLQPDYVLRVRTDGTHYIERR